MTFLNALLRRLSGQPRLVREVAADMTRLQTELRFIRKVRLQQALKHDAIVVAAKTEAEAAALLLGEPAQPGPTQLSLPITTS